MSKFAPRGWGLYEFTLRRHDAVALGVSLFLMAGLVGLAFVACAVI
jgi:hypothetical protein